MSDVKLYKMSGAGNDFVVLDGRGVDVSGFRRPERIAELCREYRTDGLMVLDNGDADFRMEFFNPDGSGGMMCGNGGRCIVAFADWLGIAPSAPDHYTFLAPDGLHSAEILSRPSNGWIQPLEDVSTPGHGQGEGPIADGRGRSERSERSSDKGCSPAVWTVKLKMIDVEGVSEVLGGYFLNTGTRHFVKFVEDVDAIDVATEGKALRWNEAFAPEGANINFVQQLPDGSLKIRTFEKGVEGETLACGTGITAAAIVAGFLGSVQNGSDGESGRISIRLQARRGDILTVDFIPDGPAKFHDIHLTGPAELL
jgi:diaminopimelate epimerase